MIELLSPDFTHSDERGKLVQIVSDGYRQVNMLYSKAGTVRGNHYHKVNNEAFFVVSGTVEVTSNSGDEQSRGTFHSGDFFLIKPYVIHSLYFTEDCVLVALYDRGVELLDSGKDIYTENYLI